MLSKKPKGSYQKHHFTRIDPIPKAPNIQDLKIDRNLMYHFLRPYQLDLFCNGITEAHSFCKLFKNHKFNRNQVRDIILDGEKHLNLKEFISSIRELNHTNSSEKDILLTYQALHDPRNMYIYIYTYVTNNLPEMKNKDQFFYDLDLEIRKVLAQAANAKNFISPPKAVDTQPCQQTVKSDSTIELEEDEDLAFLALEEDFNSNPDDDEIFM